MRSEWYKEHYIGYDKVIVAGWNENGEHKEVELNEEQKFRLEAFNVQIRDMKMTFYKELLGA
jgi:hypothetical protein